MKPLVLVSTDTMNVPEDVSATLKPTADVAYVKGNYDKLLHKAKALLVGGEKVNEEFLRKAPNLGIASRFGVGYDAVDVKACTERKVYVTHTPDVLSGAVADQTWALILGFMRRIPEADRNVRESWAKKGGRLPFGWDMEGKTLGILGLGRIGSQVVRRAQGFDVELAYYDIIRKWDMEKQYGVKYLSFEELMKSSDILSLHVPLLPSTRGIIGEKALSMMKPSAVVVNTSRGPVIDEKSLYKSLKEGRIRGAALDVFEVEPTPLENPLLKLDNVVLSPHSASATWETRRKMAEMAVRNIRAYLEGHRPPNVVPEQDGLTF
jgi:glyoxylate reductase